MGQNAEKIIFVASNTHKYVAKEGSRNLVCRRAPHGARGLKLVGGVVDDTVVMSRPAWGAWIETSCVSAMMYFGASRPAWGAWIETMTKQSRSLRSSTSRPAWGAWIETPNNHRPQPTYRRRAPHGARGLKQLVWRLCRLGLRSRPAWGAWIETPIAMRRDGVIVSRPAWGAWIETPRYSSCALRALVAPRMGRVD